MKTTITRFVRRKDFDIYPANDHSPIGVFVGEKIDNVVYVGWSKLHPLDRVFNKETGVKIATNRINEAHNGRNLKIRLPKDDATNTRYIQYMTHFAERCKKYFKTDQVVLPIIHISKKK